MTRSDFRALVQAFVAADGQPYAASDSDQNDVINECLSLYAEETLTFFDPKVTLTLTASVATYDLRDTAKVSKKICLPTNVVINNTGLRDFLGRLGPIPAKEWQAISDAYSASAGTPTRWTWESPNVLRLYPMPNSAVVVAGNNYVAGFFIPADLTNDSDEVPLVLEQEREFAAYVAARLIDPRAAGSSLEKMKRLDEASYARFVERRLRAAQIMQSYYRGDQVPQQAVQA